MLKVSSEVNEIIEFSKVISKNFGHSFLGTEHLLLALMGRKSSEEYIRSTIPDATNLNYSQLMQEVITRNGQGEKHLSDSVQMSANYKRVLSKSYIRAFSRKAEFVEEADVINVLFSENDCTAVRVYNVCKQNVFTSDKSVVKTFSLTYEMLAGMRKETPILNLYSRDVTLEALEDKLDPVIEREAEMDSVIKVLLRKNKNNPCLVGSAGVGKTAIADGIAQRIVLGKVPYELSTKRIVALDIALLLAGAKYRGDFEERLKGVFDEVKKCRNVILMIDEIHNIVNAGNGEGTLDAANILKPELARGEVSIIGATTAEEYSRTIEKDAALERRFQRIKVDEPSPEAAQRILEGLKPRYEAFHKITINDTAIKKAIELSVNELPNRYLPDKAIDLIDEAAAFVRLEGNDALSGEDVIRSFKKSYGHHFTTKENITDLIKKELHGQDGAIDTAVELLMSRSVGVLDRSPLSMLFAGPTGCGKTSLARLLSDYYFGEHSLLKIDGGEYSEGHSVSKLIGAPPGYVGYGDNGILANAIVENPNRIILFDEVEKAHPDVVRVLLNLLDDGVMRNTMGRSISFKNCIFIITTNAGFVAATGKAGFSQASQRDEKLAIEAVLGKEIVGRIDATVIFEGARDEDALEVCRELIEEYRRLCFNKGVALEVDGDVVRYVINQSEIARYGYRNLKKTFNSTVVKEIRKALLYEGDRLTKIRIYKSSGGVISHFLSFKKNGLENKALSMYNELKT